MFITVLNLDRLNAVKGTLSNALPTLWTSNTQFPFGYIAMGYLKLFLTMDGQTDKVITM